MKISINSPSYYTQKNGVVEEIYQLSKSISSKIEVSKYTDSLDIIGITPIIVPNGLLIEGAWKEDKRILLSSRMAIISLRIDYDTFYSANIFEKEKMFLDNIFKSLKIIKDKLKENFSYDEMVLDILAILKEKETHI